MLAVSIDLGTTYSCVAIWLEQKNRVEIIHNNEGNKITPFVAFTDHQRLIGDAAKDQAAINPAENSVFGIFLSFCSSHVLSCSVCIVLD
ncbi:heat shock cognate 70 kDa protein [Trifolium repens]|nr:heat shock cognate 70 kDa protein [Trifolium repens]